MIDTIDLAALRRQHCSAVHAGEPTAAVPEADAAKGIAPPVETSAA